MRYRDTGVYNETVTPVGDDMVFISIILGIILGLGFMFFGQKVKRYWMVIWGAGLVLASLSYFLFRQAGLW